MTKNFTIDDLINYAVVVMYQPYIIQPSKGWIPLSLCICECTICNVAMPSGNAETNQPFGPGEEQHEHSVPRGRTSPLFKISRTKDLQTNAWCIINIHDSIVIQQVNSVLL